jgi:hypothetical protein
VLANFLICAFLLLVIAGCSSQSAQLGGQHADAGSEASLAGAAMQWVNPRAPALAPASFQSVSTSLTMGEVIRLLGPAQADVGSGVFVLRWQVTDGRFFLVRTGALEPGVHPMSVGFFSE